MTERDWNIRSTAVRLRGWTAEYKRTGLPLSIIEGSYSQHPFFGDIWDLRFFCEIDPAEQLNRIRIRNGEAMCERFKQEWIPKETHILIRSASVKKVSA